jgi:hypothetical protein
MVDQEIADVEGNAPDFLTGDDGGDGKDDCEREEPLHILNPKPADESSSREQDPTGRRA